MQLVKLWKDAGISEAQLIQASQGWAKDATGDYSLEEALYVCDAIGEALDLPALAPVVVAVADVLSDTAWALCGGVAFSKLTEPRATKDVDVLVLDRSATISQLLQSRKFHVVGGQLKHLSGADIDVLNWESGELDVPSAVAKQALSFAKEQAAWGRRIPMVTPAGLIALKLASAAKGAKRAYQDKADIMKVLEKFGYQDLSGYSLTTAMQEEYQKLVAEAGVTE